MIVKPMKDKVLIAQVERTSTTGSGIILQGASGDGSTATGKVLAIGPDVKEVAVDDEVYLTWNKGSPVTVDGKQRVIISEADIVAVLTK